MMISAASVLRSYEARSDIQSCCVLSNHCWAPMIEVTNGGE